METIDFRGTAIGLAKSFGKATMRFKAVVQGNVDDALAPSQFGSGIGQPPASDVVHDGNAYIRLKNPVVMVGGETSSVGKLIDGDVFLQVVFNVIDAVLDTRAIVHNVSP